MKLVLDALLKLLVPLAQIIGPFIKKWLENLSSKKLAVVVSIIGGLGALCAAVLAIPALPAWAVVSLTALGVLCASITGVVYINTQGKVDVADSEVKKPNPS